MSEQMVMQLWGSSVATVCLTVGWLMGMTQKRRSERAELAEDQRIAAAVDQLDPETLEPLPFDQEAPVRRRDHRKAPR